MHLHNIPNILNVSLINYARKSHQLMRRDIKCQIIIVDTRQILDIMGIKNYIFNTVEFISIIVTKISTMMMSPLRRLLFLTAHRDYITPTCDCLNLVIFVAGIARGRV